MTLQAKTKPFEISKREVFDAWKQVKANKGAAGVDKESIEKFEANLSRNLYKLWNRMSSGSYFPQAVRRVEIPKKDGSTRPLGIPTVYDRIAQEVGRARLEVLLEPHFSKDSFGYRRGKSAHDAVKLCRERNWQYDWVVDVDIQAFFDTIDHELLLKAVNKHCQDRWLVLYIERWLKAPIEYADGSKETNRSGTPQGGVISPLLANLFLHYAFDEWMKREYPALKFERYADDIVIHCPSKDVSEELKETLRRRLLNCGLTLHPEKTRIVYCKDSARKGKYPIISYKFLGYTFQPRAAKNRRSGKMFTSFLPAASREAQKRLRSELRAKHLRQCVSLSIEEVAEVLNPMLRGWFNYFARFYASELRYVCYSVDRRLTGWARNKYRWSFRRSTRWLDELKCQQPGLFAHWAVARNSHG